MSDDEERRFLHEFKARSASRSMWDRSYDLADGGGGTGAIIQWQGPVTNANAAATSESEESSVSGSDPLSDKAIRCVLHSVCWMWFFFVKLVKTAYLVCKAITVVYSRWQKLFLSMEPKLNYLAAEAQNDHCNLTMGHKCPN